LYWYDEVGNRTKLMYYDGSATATTTYGYSDRNELTKATVGANNTIYKYDPRGNLTKNGTIEYYWDSQDKMTKVVNGAKTVEYKYDLLGRRACKRVNGGAWWWYFYDGLKVLFEGSDTSSNRGYYTVTPAAVGGIVSRVTPGVRRFYHYDRLGNVMAITDVSGKPYAEYTMDAFGNVLQKGTSTGYSSEFATDPQPYHLTTKEYDPDVWTRISFLWPQKCHPKREMPVPHWSRPTHPKACSSTF
jgi:YD repeat-containing protein